MAVFQCVLYFCLFAGVVQSLQLVPDKASDQNSGDNNNRLMQGSVPIVINTWAYSNATKKAWKLLSKGANPIDALEAGLTECEIEQCGLAVGYGANPTEKGEVTLDAFLMDGNTMNIGGVGSLRRIKNAVGVAKRVLMNTEHSLLAGSLATDFAKMMGFPEETLSTNQSVQQWINWKNNNCQPNFRVNVVPNPKRFCGPYKPLDEKYNPSNNGVYANKNNRGVNEQSHDTITMLAIDGVGNVAAGGTTNGLEYKIPGRVADSTVPGAGAYADATIGAASATGDGDKMMRFLPSFYIVEQMRQGVSPAKATMKAIKRISKFYPGFWGALIAVNLQGEFGVACSGMKEGFPFCVHTEQGLKIYRTRCI